MSTNKLEHHPFLLNRGIKSTRLRDCAGENSKTFEDYEARSSSSNSSNGPFGRSSNNVNNYNAKGESKVLSEDESGVRPTPYRPRQRIKSIVSSKVIATDRKCEAADSWELLGDSRKDEDCTFLTCGGRESSGGSRRSEQPSSQPKRPGSPDSISTNRRNSGRLQHSEVSYNSEVNARGKNSPLLLAMAPPIVAERHEREEWLPNSSLGKNQAVTYNETDMTLMDEPPGGSVSRLKFGWTSKKAASGERPKNSMGSTEYASEKSPSAAPDNKQGKRSSASFLSRISSSFSHHSSDPATKSSKHRLASQEGDSLGSSQTECPSRSYPETTSRHLTEGQTAILDFLSKTANEDSELRRFSSTVVGDGGLGYPQDDTLDTACRGRFYSIGWTGQNPNPPDLPQTPLPFDKSAGLIEDSATNLPSSPEDRLSLSAQGVRMRESSGDKTKAVVRRNKRREGARHRSSSTSKTPLISSHSKDESVLYASQSVEQHQRFGISASSMVLSGVRGVGLSQRPSVTEGSLSLVRDRTDSGSRKHSGRVLQHITSNNTSQSAALAPQRQDSHISLSEPFTPTFGSLICGPRATAKAATNSAANLDHAESDLTASPLPVQQQQYSSQSAGAGNAAVPSATSSLTQVKGLKSKSATRKAPRGGENQRAQQSTQLQPLSQSGFPRAGSVSGSSTSTVTSPDICPPRDTTKHPSFSTASGLSSPQNSTLGSAFRFIKLAELSSAFSGAHRSCQERRRSADPTLFSQPLSRLDTVAQARAGSSSREQPLSSLNKEKRRRASYAGIIRRPLEGITEEEPSRSNQQSVAECPLEALQRTTNSIASHTSSGTRTGGRKFWPARRYTACPAEFQNIHHTSSTTAGFPLSKATASSSNSSSKRGGKDSRKEGRNPSLQSLPKSQGNAASASGSKKRLKQLLKFRILKAPLQSDTNLSQSATIKDNTMGASLGNCCAGRDDEATKAKAKERLEATWGFLQGDHVKTDIDKFDEAFAAEDIRGFTALLQSTDAIDELPEKMHPWAADPKTVGALAATQLAILAAKEDVPAHRDAIRDAGAIPQLVQLMESKEQDRVQAAAVALSFLAVDNHPNCVEMYNAGALKPLIEGLTSPIEGMRGACAQTSRNIFVLDKKYREEFIRLGGIPHLVALLDIPAGAAKDDALFNQLEAVYHLEDFMMVDGEEVKQFAAEIRNGGVVRRLEALAKVEAADVVEAAQYLLARVAD